MRKLSKRIQRRISGWRNGQGEKEVEGVEWRGRGRGRHVWIVESLPKYPYDYEVDGE